jgi:hypothetical protein
VIVPERLAVGYDLRGHGTPAVRSYSSGSWPFCVSPRTSLP